MSQTHDSTAHLLREHPAVRLLRKDSAPLIITFFKNTFHEARKAQFGSRELTTRLTDLLFVINDSGQGADNDTRYPRPAREYLETWTDENFLRQFYERDADEATFELTAAGEQALQWFAELGKSEFVGAESRLRQVFEQIRQLAENTTEDVDARRQQLLERRAAIDTQLAALDRGELATLGETGIRERLQDIEETSRRLLYDFRTIEDNFRRLNARARQELMAHHASRGDALTTIFDGRAEILDSDQGRTFRGFWEFLMDERRRDEQEAYLQQIFDLPGLAERRATSFLPRMESALVDAGNRVNRTTDRLVEQLRRFVQTRAYADNQRITSLISDIEKLAGEVKTDPPKQHRFTTIAGLANINLPMDRSLYEPPARLDLTGNRPVAGDADAVVTDALFEQEYVDVRELKDRIKKLLRNRRQISLGEIAEAIPPRRGLTELIAYFGIATQYETKNRAVISAGREETIAYATPHGERVATFPETLFLNE